MLLTSQEDNRGLIVKINQLWYSPQYRLGLEGWCKNCAPPQEVPLFGSIRRIPFVYPQCNFTEKASQSLLQLRYSYCPHLSFWVNHWSDSYWLSYSPLSRIKIRAGLVSLCEIMVVHLLFPENKYYLLIRDMRDCVTLCGRYKRGLNNEFLFPRVGRKY